MNLLKCAALSILMLSSIASAKVALEAVITDGKGILSIPAMILELNQPCVEIMDDVRFEATLTESDTIVFDLASKEEDGNFVSFLHPELALNTDETKGTLEFVTKDGSTCLLLVQANQIPD